MKRTKNIMNHKIFHYYPVDVKNSYTGVNVKGFKFPKGDEYDATSAADVENLQQMQIYFGVHTVIASLQDLMRVGSNKTNKLYEPLYDQLIKDYTKQCIAVLSLASSMCWVLTDPKNPGKGYTHKLTPDQALYEIEPAIKGLMLAVQRKMDLTFPAHLVKNIARLEIEKEMLDIEETSGALKKTLRR